MSQTVHTSLSGSPASQSALTRFCASLKRTKNPDTLELHQKRLDHLALHFDPFTGTLDDECAQIVAHYKLEEAVADPFRFTNLLLGMLGKLEEKRRALPH